MPTILRGWIISGEASMVSVRNEGQNRRSSWVRKGAGEVCCRIARSLNTGDAEGDRRRIVSPSNLPLDTPRAEFGRDDRVRRCLRRSLGVTFSPMLIVEECREEACGASNSRCDVEAESE
jgi:hypothetical protein